MRHAKLALALFVLLPVLPSCTDDAADVTLDPAEATAGKADGATTALPDVQCTGTPAAGPSQSWRHLTSRVIATATPNHRGFDLVAGASDTSQIIAGEASYGTTIDKALEDEWVDLYACRAGSWSKLGSALTDGEGGFRLTLTGTKRLPLGQRDLFVSVRGDRSGARFLGLVAPAGTALAVSDVDGTLTSSEDAFPTALVTGAAVAIHPGASALFARLAARGYRPVYLTARGDAFTAATRSWLAASGMPRGPMRLAPHRITLPGAPTVAFKSDAMFELESHGLDIAIGVGNRASDVSAYGQVGVAGDRTFIKLPEFSGEVAADLQAGRARGVASYGDLMATVGALPQR